MPNDQRKLATEIHKLTSYFAGRSEAARIACTFAMLAAIGTLDYITGDKFDLEVLYLLPIALVTWASGRNAGLVTALTASGVWWLTDRYVGHDTFPFYFFWSWISIIVTFSVVVIIIAKLKEAQNKTQTALHRSEGRYQTLVTAVPYGIYESDLSGTITLANPAFHRILEYAEGELYGKRIYDFFSSDAECEKAKRDLQDHLGLQPNSTPYFTKIKKKDGALADIQVDWVYKRNEQRVVTGFISVVTDITDRKLAEDLARRQRERLELTSRLIAANEIASTLAHELNQPLAAIANYNTGSIRRLCSGKWNLEDVLEAMEKTRAQAERAGGIIRRVRELVNRREPNRVPSRINDIISDLAGMLEFQDEKSGIKLLLDLAADLPSVSIDRGMIEQVILNLLKNAREAMGDTPSGNRKILVRSALNGNNAVEVSIRDYGHGLPEELRENLFLPFFTTKPDGMGMGLNICRSIIEFHDGRLWASANLGGGSTFNFTLPAAGHQHAGA
ncbi:MAG TPA: ATP-binding protein [Burkholderiales bacterium]|nr:ATP-binding protein [Burkholderiales bacterium]